MNYGMLSVDLAFGDFCRVALGHGVRIEHFNVEEELVVDCGRSRQLRYGLLHSPEEQFAEFQAVVIWGDFTTSQAYGDGVAKHLMSKHGIERTSALDVYYRNLLLEQCSDSLLRRVFVVSSSILPNSEGALAPRYRDAVSRLYRLAGAIIPRDPMSAAMAQILRGNSVNVTCGVDAAFFLSSALPPYVGGRDGIGYSFGRTAGPKTSVYRRFAAMRFCQAVSRSTKLRLRHIRWNSSGGDAEGFHNTLDELRRCRLVITDTYHCAVNALREGVPVICIGDGSKHQTGTLGDKKKEYLFHGLMAQEMYVFADNLSIMRAGADAAGQYVADVLDEQYSSRILGNVHTAMRVQTAAFQRAILELAS